jgi:hypothetical protein
MNLLTTSGKHNSTRPGKTSLSVSAGTARGFPTLLELSFHDRTPCNFDDGRIGCSWVSLLKLSVSLFKCPVSGMWIKPLSIDKSDEKQVTQRLICVFNWINHSGWLKISSLIREFIVHIGKSNPFSAEMKKLGWWMYLDLLKGGYLLL